MNASRVARSLVTELPILRKAHLGRSHMERPASVSKGEFLEGLFLRTLDTSLNITLALGDMRGFVRHIAPLCHIH